MCFYFKQGMKRCIHIMFYCSVMNNSQYLIKFNLKNFKPFIAKPFNYIKKLIIIKKTNYISKKN